MEYSADQYASEPVRYPALPVVDLEDLEAQGANESNTYTSIAINRVNDFCLRRAVFEGEYKWHIILPLTNSL